MVLKDLVQTPNTQGGHVPNNPVLDGALDGALISDNDDSFISLMQNQREILD